MITISEQIDLIKNAHPDCTEAEFDAAVQSICLAIRMLQEKYSGAELDLAIELLRQHYEQGTRAVLIV